MARMYVKSVIGLCHLSTVSRSYNHSDSFAASSRNQSTSLRSSVWHANWAGNGPTIWKKTILTTHSVQYQYNMVNAYGSAYMAEMSPTRRGSIVYGTRTLLVFSNVWISCNTETPVPVPRLYILMRKCSRSSLASAATWPSARSITWI